MLLNNPPAVAPCVEQRKRAATAVKYELAITASRRSAFKGGALHNQRICLTWAIGAFHDTGVHVQ
jgi:hypothetical protein